jgi:hypothetical protein
MKRIIKRNLFGQSSRFVSNKSIQYYQGIREKFDENQARLYFDQWIKSLW